MGRFDVRLLTPEQALRCQQDWQDYLQGFLEHHEADRQPRRSALERLLTYLRG